VSQREVFAPAVADGKVYLGTFSGTLNDGL
jgi:hypothetical protein